MAFSVTVTSPQKRSERISRSMGIYAGKVSITSYNQTLVECTAITRYFKPTSNATTGGYADGICTVQIDGPSSGGYLVKWDYTTGAFQCFAPTNLVFSGSATGGNVTWGSALGAVGLAAASCPGAMQTAVVEAAANTLIGTFGFVAVGFIK